MIERSRRDRLASALAAGALQAGLLYLLIAGLTVRHGPAPAADPTLLVPLTEPTMPPDPPPDPLKTSLTRPEGEAAPPNQTAHPTEIVAPPPIVPVPAPPTVIAAPIAGPAADPSAGAARDPGPGTGAGGIGNGLGGGRSGSGDGGGGGDGGSPPRRTSGRIKDSDYPKQAGIEGVSGTVTVRYAVEPDGKADECRIEQTSGSDALDDATCRLIERRFRFAPARDEAGRPVRSILIENHSWYSKAPEGGR